MELQHRIGIIMGGVYKKVNRELLSGILERAYALDFSAYVFTLNEANRDPKAIYGEENLFQMINLSLLDGIVYLPYTFTKEEYLRFTGEFLEKHCSLPVISVSSASAAFPCIWYDDRAETAAILRHLIHVHNCRDILFLTGREDTPVSLRRRDGYRDALEEAGIPYQENHVIYGDFWVHSAQQLAEELASGRRHIPDAIACANDCMAIALCDALRKKGIAVPDRVRITGYDGTVEAALHEPGITTYHTSWKQLGRNAMGRLYEAITGISAADTAPETGTLLARTTCGCTSGVQDGVMEWFSYQRMEENYLDSDFSSRLYAAGNLKELINRIFSSTFIFMDEAYWDKECYTLCLCEDWNKTEYSEAALRYRTSGYSERMILAVPGMERQTFPVSQMVPDGWNDTEARSVTFFTVVHFQERCFGYSLFRMEGIADGFSQHYIRFGRAVNNGLMFLCTQDQMKSLAYHHYISEIRDELTGLYHSGGFGRVWKDAVREAETCHETIVLLCLHLNGLQQMQELCGSVVCDKLIAEFAVLLQGCCENRERCVRMSTAEFAVIGTEKPTLRSSSVIPARLMERFELYTRRTELPVRLSIQKTMRVWDAMPFPDPQEAFTEARNMLKAAAAKRPSYSEQMRYKDLSALRSTIYQNPEENWSTAVCADRMGLSLTHFQRVYQSAFGVSCAKDIRRSKLTYAKQLLLSTKDTLQEIAAKCGYEYSHFMRVFHAETGMTPTEYRRQ